MASSRSHLPVLLLAFANDDDKSLRQLDEEQRALKHILEPARKAGKYEVVILPAARAEDIINAFLSYRQRIRIFHYAGHSGADAIFLKEPYQKKEGIQAKNLAEFLALQSGLELIFLNSCLSLSQARKYHEVGAKVVLATSTKISDNAALAFAKQFYTALVGGADILEAFQAAEASIPMTSTDESVRGLGLDSAEHTISWQLFPEIPDAPWRLPMVAKRLTRIPTIDLSRAFIGREDDMQRLKETLEQAPSVVLMNGLGGIGKTVLATAYVQQHGDQYDHLVWINRGEDLIDTVAFNEELADTLGLPFEKEEEPAVRFRKILRKLQQIPGKNLLIIDNAQDQVAKKEVYEHLPGPPYWRVLLTSRLKLDGFERLELDTLTPEASRQLFRTYYKGECTAEELESLLQEVGYHTLTVELLAKTLDKLNNLLSVSDLTEVLQQKQLNDPDLQEKIRTNHSKEDAGIYMHLMKAFELIDLEEQEIWLLKQFVVLPVERYPVEKLADLLQEKALGLNKVLNSLAAKGWLTLHEDKTFSIHRLIRQVTEYQSKPEFLDVEELVNCLTNKLNKDAYTNPLATIGPWISYSTTVANYLLSTHYRLAVLNNSIALALGNLGHYKKALVYNQKTLAIFEGMDEPNPFKLATSYNNLAEAHYRLGQLQEAFEYHKKALTIREELLLDLNHLDLANSYNNLAEVYRGSGNFKEALKYHQKAVPILEASVDADNPYLATCYNNIGLTYCDLGLFDRAEGFLQKALKIQEKVLDEKHPELATTYYNMAGLYRELGQYEMALTFHQKSIDIRMVIFKNDHPELANSFHNIAATYDSIGNYQEALIYYQKALNIQESVPDNNQPDLADAYNSIAETYRKLGQWEDALNYHQKSLDILLKLFERDHPRFANSYNNMAETYRGLGNYDEALIWQKESQAILEKKLNPNHPKLGFCYHNAAETYRGLGQYEKALYYHRRAIIILELALPVNHPSLATVYNITAATYNDLGNKIKGAEYQAKAAAISKKDDD